MEFHGFTQGGATPLFSLGKCTDSERDLQGRNGDFKGAQELLSGAQEHSRARLRIPVESSAQRHQNAYVSPENSTGITMPVDRASAWVYPLVGI